ncbi:biotin--[acetyl-CoA-carboxylase] ligase [Aquibaculum sediminis]|uniref:biotin--[acetyl-CoA-carboxylase] ligase n=1 Tax=Aquibaculum sediminis TaxID=3231907 RepID=UPI003456ABAF
MSTPVDRAAPRLPPVYRLVALDSVASTMDEARRLAEEEGAEDGTLVWAREQSGGRGRLGRQWESPRGNLYLTLVLRPDCPPAEAAQLGFLAAVAVSDAIGAVSPPVETTFKWPNDVLLHGNKVAGILMESRSTPDGGLDYLLLGCGVNVAHFPRDLMYTATSMHYEGVPKDVTEVDLLEAFGRHFLSWVSRWLDDGFAPVRKAWLRHAAGIGERIEVRLPRETLTGVFRELDEAGHLILELEGGERRRIASGEVFLTERTHAAGH